MRQYVSAKSIRGVLTFGDTVRITRSMSHLTPIYEIWENAEAMAADIGELGVTVRQWRNRGNIPPKYWQRITEAAARKGRTLSPNDFLPPDQRVAA